MRKLTWKYKDSYRNYYVATAIEREVIGDDSDPDFFYTRWGCNISREGGNLLMGFDIDTQLDDDPSLHDIIKEYVGCVNSLAMEWLYDNPAPIKN